MSEQVDNIIRDIENRPGYSADAWADIEYAHNIIKALLVGDALNQDDPRDDLTEALGVLRDALNARQRGKA